MSDTAATSLGVSKMTDLDRTSTALDDLPRSYVVLEDLELRRARVHLDHAAIGPTGLYVIVTRRFDAGVAIRKGVARHGPHRLDHVTELASQQADAVGRMVEVEATPVVCVHGGLRLERFFERPSVQGVMFSAPEQLSQTIDSGPQRLSDEEVRHVAEVLQRDGLPPGFVDRLAALDLALMLAGAEGAMGQERTVRT